MVFSSRRFDGSVSDNSTQHIDVHALIAAVRGSQPEREGIVPKNYIQIMVMGVVAAAGALVWNTVTSQPENLSLLQQQTAEIRTTVLEMKTTLGDINSRLDNNTRATADQQAKITGLESTVKSNTDRIDRLERSLQDRER
jgi:peptidoglycan hydrolase CwlO-like protein